MITDVLFQISINAIAKAVTHHKRIAPVTNTRDLGQMGTTASDSDSEDFACGAQTCLLILSKDTYEAWKADRAYQALLCRTFAQLGSALVARVVVVGPAGQDVVVVPA